MIQSTKFWNRLKKPSFGVPTSCKLSFHKRSFMPSHFTIRVSHFLQQQSSIHGEIETFKMLGHPFSFIASSSIFTDINDGPNLLLDLDMELTQGAITQICDLFLTLIKGFLSFLDRCLMVETLLTTHHLLPL